jgi:uncharacterized membrane protein YfhO
MKLVYSGDVKIYENLRPAPRAFVRYGGVDFADAAQIVRDDPERVTVHIESPISQSAQPQTLILRDACYPGWQAFVDGKPADIACVDGLFRAVQFYSPARTVEFVYAPQSVSAGVLLSVAGFVAWALIGIVVFARRGRGYAG